MLVSPEHLLKGNDTIDGGAGIDEMRIPSARNLQVDLALGLARSEAREVERDVENFVCSPWRTPCCGRTNAITYPAVTQPPGLRIARSPSIIAG